MNIQKFEIPDLMLIEVPRFGDSRGFFTERFKKDEYKKAGIEADFVQDNYSRSAFGVLRGLHFQYDQPQAKLITCTRGRIFDVAVDIRKKSKTFGKVITVVLDGAQPSWFWIPAGFAHGFAVISDDGADLWYKVDALYNPQGEGAIHWNDPELNIQWPKEILSTLSLSGRDQRAASFADYKNNSKF
ncbi:MAG: dTDP-4-dehydrorhamnose 3,5-epimerase [Bdellovibrio sp.]